MVGGLGGREEGVPLRRGWRGAPLNPPRVARGLSPPGEVAVVRAPSFDVRGKAAQRDGGASGGPKGRCGALGAVSARGARGRGVLRKRRGAAPSPASVLRRSSRKLTPEGSKAISDILLLGKFQRSVFSRSCRRAAMRPCTSFPVFPFLPVSFLTGVMWGCCNSLSNL